MRTAKWLIVMGSIVLLATAVLHSTGYREVTEAIQATGAKPLLVSSVKALWLMFSIHLFVLSAVFVSAISVAGARRVILVAAAIPLADTVLLFHFVGIFIGTIALATATVLFLLGGLLSPTPLPT